MQLGARIETELERRDFNNVWSASTLFGNTSVNEGNIIFGIV